MIIIIVIKETFINYKAGSLNVDNYNKFFPNVVHCFIDSSFSSPLSSMNLHILQKWTTIVIWTFYLRLQRKKKRVSRNTNSRPQYSAQRLCVIVAQSHFHPSKVSSSLRIAIGHRLTWNAKKGLLLAAACLFANLTDLKLNLGWMEGRKECRRGIFCTLLEIPETNRFVVSFKKGFYLMLSCKH